MTRMQRAGLFVACVCASSSALAQTATQDREWRAYGGDLGSTRYAPLDQIDASNFGSLEVAWRFSMANLGPDARVSLSKHAARGRRRALHDGRLAPRGHGARRRDRRAALGLQPERRRARRGCTAQAFGPRARVLAERQRQTCGLRDAGLPARRAQCGDRAADRRLRRGRHRRSVENTRSRRRLGHDPDRHELAADGRERRRHRSAPRTRRSRPPTRPTTSSATSAASTSSPGSCFGRSTRFRGAASRATRRGSTARPESGRPATRASGRRSRRTSSSGSRICPSNRRTATCTAACVPAATSTARASSPWICAPASAAGIFKRRIIRSGTTTFRPRRSSSTPSRTARRSRRSRRRPSRACCSC